MTAINPYLNFPGNAEEAFLFYKSILGGEFTTLSRYKDGPPMEGAPPLSEDVGNKILHIALPLGSNMLMASDAIPPFCPASVPGTNVSLSLHPESEAEGRRLFDALSAGGQVQMAYAPTFWGAVFGAFTDKFGISWMVNYQLPEGA